MPSANPTIAFFGATGGCAMAILTPALAAGYTCTALVRTPSKLTKLLAARSISQSTIDAHLTIHQGNATDAAAVRAALLTPDKQLVSLVVSGVGGSPKFTPNPLRPTLDQPSICADVTRAILSSLDALAREHGSSPAAAACQKPFVLTISTTGISSRRRDIPLAMVPLYHWMLPVPHADKKNMEDLLVAAAKTGAQAPIAGFVNVRASLLMDGPAKGLAKIRVGWEDEHECQPAVGYTITREDVGLWMFEELVKSSEGRSRWQGKMVTLTQ